MSRLWVNRGGLAKQLGSTPLGAWPPVWFSASSFWNSKLAANAPLVNDGNNYPQKFANQASYTTTSTPIAGSYPAGYNDVINVNSFSSAWYIMPSAGHTRAKVTYMTNNGAGPPASDSQNNGLQLQLNTVPVPLGPGGVQYEHYYGKTIQASGSDGHTVFYDPYTDELWDFWKFKTVTDTTDGSGNPLTWHYECGYAGYLPSASVSSGIFSNGWGARASGLPVCAGMIGMLEIANGIIPHKIAIAQVSETATPLPPATRNDGAGSTVPSGNNSDAVPQGIIFRLPATYTVPSSLPAFEQMVHTAIRDYGLVVVDRSTTLAMYGEDPRAIGTPYTKVTSNPWPALSSAGMLSSISNACYNVPWSQLQQVAYP